MQQITRSFVHLMIYYFFSFPLCQNFFRIRLKLFFLLTEYFGWSEVNMQKWQKKYKKKKNYRAEAEIWTSKVSNFVTFWDD